MNKRKRSVFIDYTLVYLLIAVSGIPFFTADKKAIFAGFFFSIIVFLIRRKKVGKELILVLGILIIISFGQIIHFKFFPFLGFASLLLYYTYPYIVLKCIGVNFIKIYVDILLFFSVTSLIIFSLTYFFPQFYYFLNSNIAPIFEREIHSSNYSYNTNILIYTLKSYGDGVYELYRNSGPFWEAGAFAGFLIIAFMFNTFYSKNIFNRRNYIILITIISTLSTGGFLALSTFLLLFFYFEKKISAVLIYIPIVILISIFSYKNVNFIGGKIENQIEDATEFTTGTDTGRERTISFLLDFKQSLKSPLWGFGRNSITKHGKTSDKLTELDHRNNGLGYLLVTFGFPFTFFFFYKNYRSFQKLVDQYSFNKKYAISILVTIVVLGFSQGWFSKPLFISFLYLSIIFINKPFYYKKDKFSR